MLMGSYMYVYLSKARVLMVSGYFWSCVGGVHIYIWKCSLLIKPVSTSIFKNVFGTTVFMNVCMCKLLVCVYVCVCVCVCVCLLLEYQIMRFVGIVFVVKWFYEWFTNSLEDLWGLSSSISWLSSSSYRRYFCLNDT